jgi:hypothetical protein
MKTYKVASEEGAQRYGAEVGEEVELDLEDEQETALLAAGWLEETTKKQAKEAKR